jgi:hypothetical protein
MKKKPKPWSAPEKDTENRSRAETVARYKAGREAAAKDLFQDYDFPLVAQIAAQISSENTKPDDAVESALRILDAARRKLKERAQKRATIIQAEVPTHALQYVFSDGTRMITHQENRPGRAEEYFGKFLRSAMGREAGAKELGRLRREGFTLDEIRKFEAEYEEFRPRQRKKL